MAKKRIVLGLEGTPKTEQIVWYKGTAQKDILNSIREVSYRATLELSDWSHTRIQSTENDCLNFKQLLLKMFLLFHEWFFYQKSVNGTALHILDWISSILPLWKAKISMSFSLLASPHPACPGLLAPTFYFQFSNTGFRIVEGVLQELWFKV